ncbi:RimJ/RimL family protein N-acetyltransferase [Stackebrandtia albiflava]|uniref:RimJ/RimL family protein N-acetyltransferase n=1 Tax=Stackebrandtia albiflava TaxID=406432 RepID=A0A562V485_9ACTN|nr:GNAT family protein [Stackebrandtia albiflava]TWJ12642.1 RimJ/RimL family protein N-acetyltransferase [Stackebrandtia albiflava]
MTIRYARLTTDDGDALVDFLTGEDWPFHTGGRPDPTRLRERFDAGGFDDAQTRTYWQVTPAGRTGLIRLYDLTDDTAMFDLRLTRNARGRGRGRDAVTWLTGRVFTDFPTVTRLEATTRQDNRAMRRVLTVCGYVKEAHYRRAWPAPDGVRHDSVGYAMLRHDWSTGITTPVDWHDTPEKEAASR